MNRLVPVVAAAGLALGAFAATPASAQTLNDRAPVFGGGFGYGYQYGPGYRHAQSPNWDNPRLYRPRQRWVDPGYGYGYGYGHGWGGPGVVRRVQPVPGYGYGYGYGGFGQRCRTVFATRWSNWHGQYVQRPVQVCN